MALVIAPVVASDWEAVRSIYAEGIATGEATFETAVPGWSDWDAKHLAGCRLAARRDDRIVGWTALSGVSDRPVYRGVAEVSIYIAEAERGAGVGKALLTAAVEASERAGIWMLQGVMFPENAASVRLHRACGFREVGNRCRIGQLRGKWRDTLLMERRSEVVGV